MILPIEYVVVVALKRTLIVCTHNKVEDSPVANEYVRICCAVCGLITFTLFILNVVCACIWRDVRSWLVVLGHDIIEHAVAQVDDFVIASHVESLAEGDEKK